MTIATFYRQRFLKTHYSKLKIVYFLLPLSIYSLHLRIPYNMKPQEGLFSLKY